MARRSDNSTSTDLFANYSTEGFFDEMFSEQAVRPHYRSLFQALNQFSVDEFRARCELAKLSLLNQGITFTVYGDRSGVETPFPIDLIPRIIPEHEWQRVEKGLEQRVRALNLFLDDIYHDGKILKDGVIPRELVVNAPHYRRNFVGAEVPGGIYVHICGSDLIRDIDGTYRVLEDNCRTPSGVSYMIENRLILMRVFPRLFNESRVVPIDHYPSLLLDNLISLCPKGISEPKIALLTPGVHNSAYFEHSFLAQQMGIELVEGRDLFVDDAKVYMKTTRGPDRVHVIYRRVDDDFIDPLAFRPNSMLGVPGLINAYRAGNVALANGIGTGVADDKAIYPYVPKMIHYYLDQNPILEQVETYLGWKESDLSYILENAQDLVIKETNNSGGYGLLIGPQASASELEGFLAKVKADPRNHIAQPLVSLSRSPCFIENHFEGRHVDLRPYILCSEDSVKIVPGGLTRVAFRQGSYVVNSSQGGGSKDTWIVQDTEDVSDFIKQSQHQPSLSVGGN